MNVAILICTYGEQRWADLASEHAYPSAVAAAHAGVTVHRVHDPGGTLAEVRNTAAADVTAEWLCFLDADDQLGAGYIDAMRAARRSTAAQIFELENDGEREKAHELDYTPILYLPHVQYVRDGRYIDWAKLPAAGRPVVEVNAAVIGTLVPRELFLEAGGFRDEPLYEDWSCWLRCIRAGAITIAVPDAVYLADGTPGRNEPDIRLRKETYWKIRREHDPHLSGMRWPV